MRRWPVSNNRSRAADLAGHVHHMLTMGQQPFGPAVGRRPCCRRPPRSARPRGPLFRALAGPFIPVAGVLAAVVLGSAQLWWVCLSGGHRQGSPNRHATTWRGGPIPSGVGLTARPAAGPNLRDRYRSIAHGSPQGLQPPPLGIPCATRPQSPPMAAFGCIPAHGSACGTDPRAWQWQTSSTRVTSVPLCRQGRGFGALECAPRLVAVKVVRPVGRCTLTAPARRRGGRGAEAGWGFATGLVPSSVGPAGPGSG